ncbi:TlpA family protein disulfide reductase, partial [candidate division KSB1 bacterium]|nr:TlpA family protein disulfide reductase [candidate division KSB1 bacterium]
MRDFIAHNAKFVLDWGQLILVLAIIIGLGIIYMLGRKNKYHLPRGIFGWLSAVLSLFFIVLSVLAFVGITMVKPHTGMILQQFEEIKGGKAPNLSFKLVSDDTEHDISEYFGNVILVNIWATWCPPCLKEMPDLNRLQKVYADKGLTVIALSDESR